MNSNFTNLPPTDSQPFTKPKSFQTNKIALLAGLTFAGVLSLAIYVGSHGLRNFDPALVWYAVASVLAAFAVGCRFIPRLIHWPEHRI